MRKNLSTSKVTAEHPRMKQTKKQTENRKSISVLTAKKHHTGGRDVREDSRMKNGEIGF